MKILNRLPDVKKLESNILQDYLKLVIKPQWAEELYEIAKRKVNGQYKASYQPIYKRMRDKGVENYTVEDMDISCICQIVLYEPSLLAGTIDNQIKNSVRGIMIDIRDDRNDYGHLSDNEADEELYDLGRRILRDLKTFVELVDDKSTFLDEEELIKFRKKSKEKINNLQKTLDEERIELIQRHREIDMNVESIIEDADPRRRWSELHSFYMEKWRVNKAAEDAFDFFTKSSEKGIPYAHPMAANVYCMKKEYKKMEQCLMLLVISPEALRGNFVSAIKTINTCLAEGYHKTAEIDKIIDTMRRRGMTISEKDGEYIFEG